MNANAPHPPLGQYHADSARREGFVRSLFDTTAPSYDQINTIFGLGTGAWYRRHSLLKAGLKPGDRVLDVAVGTGLVAREALRVVGDAGSVIGLDLSAGMLAQAKRHLPIPLIQARAEALPIAEASIDFLSIGYALRHVADLPAVFAEFRRVLKPGGRLAILEIGRPEGRIAHAMLRAYIGRIIPALCRVSGARQSAELMRYYWDTIETCVAPSTIVHRLREAAFSDVTARTEMGVFRTYLGRRDAVAVHH